ncbi:MAG: hypothetical protein H0T46_20755 [Deltaproteobacteria bacterium]|nr:hypothetical protein [Deltaproteobacteria bacterium]
MRTAALILAVGVVAGGCGTAIGPDPGLEGLAVSKVAPDTIIPGTKLVVKGTSFVESQWGAATLRLKGKAGGKDIDAKWPATFVDYMTMTVAVDGGKIDELGGDVDFEGAATIEVLATSDDNTYTSEPLTVDLDFRTKLTPTPNGLDATGVIFVNDQLQVSGGGFLLGGDEGTTVARVTGCFKLNGTGTCTNQAGIEIPMLPVDPLSREMATFAFSPKIAGIKPGSFTGKVTVINKQTGIAPIMATALDIDYDLVTSQVFMVDPPAASLGQYVFVHGGGFVGGEPNATTELELTGTFKKTGSNPAPISMTLIPEFVEGRLTRYIVNTNDELGQSLDLRTDTGSFTGTITPVISYGSDRVRGVSKNVALQIAPVKQVVYLDFLPSYVEGLRDFGLRAVHAKIRDRIVEVCREAYRGVNVDIRVEVPTDFALYEHVELVGVDPNDMGLFGYDNSAGKDNGNLRLYDRLGGVNALTQQDGYAGFGGVFLRSLLGFSKHPGKLAKGVPGADPVFDKIFDAFRADQGGEPVTSADLSGDLPALTSGAGCPASDRKTRIQCAIYVLGNLVGGTLSHEIGHSVGLANPFAEGFHNAGDAPNRLMDSGGDRPFLERAMLEGQGPAVFCDDEYAYLRMILPTSESADDITRPGCF